MHLGKTAPLEKRSNKNAGKTQRIDSTMCHSNIRGDPWVIAGCDIRLTLNHRRFSHRSERQNAPSREMHARRTSVSAFGSQQLDKMTKKSPFFMVWRVQMKSRMMNQEADTGFVSSSFPQQEMKSFITMARLVDSRQQVLIRQESRLQQEKRG